MWFESFLFIIYCLAYTLHSLYLFIVFKPVCRTSLGRMGNNFLLNKNRCFYPNWKKRIPKIPRYIPYIRHLTKKFTIYNLRNPIEEDEPENVRPVWVSHFPTNLSGFRFVSPSRLSPNPEGFVRERPEGMRLLYLPYRPIRIRSCA